MNIGTARRSIAAGAALLTVLALPACDSPAGSGGEPSPGTHDGDGGREPMVS